MESVVPLYKPLGKTPLETIEQYRQDAEIPTSVPLGYAGRLDPMAEGVLLCLVGEENKKRKEYERLPKTYEIDILFGISTDTYDILGILQENVHSDLSIPKRDIQDILTSFVGAIDQPYPPYSAARVNGKPLYYWARRGLLDEITIPTKIVHVDAITLKDMKTVQAENVLQTATERIVLVTGDFRQEAILNSWKQHINNEEEVFHIATISVRCSSGTYMRSIAHEVGKILGCGAIAYRIVRTSVGPYSILKPWL